MTRSHPTGLPLARHRVTVRRTDAGLLTYERALARAGFDRIAGIDEAGRGACAGPLVVAACILRQRRSAALEGLTDSKLLTAAQRERLYDKIIVEAVSYSVVVIPPGEIDAIGLHVCNVAGMRRALAALTPGASFALTDGFGVPGLGVPSVAMWKGDQVAGCIAAASILAKVTRDAMMTELDEQFPQYGFAEHKGYSTSAHSAALTEHGPCAQHRFSYVNVRRANKARAGVS